MEAIAPPKLWLTYYQLKQLRMPELPSVYYSIVGALSALITFSVTATRLELFIRRACLHVFVSKSPVPPTPAVRTFAPHRSANKEMWWQQQSFHSLSCATDVFFSQWSHSSRNRWYMKRLKLHFIHILCLNSFLIFIFNEAIITCTVARETQ